MLYLNEYIFAQFFSGQPRCPLTIEETAMKRGSRLKSWIFLPWAIWILSSYAQAGPIMVDRNLFSPDRKPPTDQPAAQNQQPGRQNLQVRSIQLDGVFFRDDKKTALIRMKNPTGTAGPRREGEKGKGTESPFRSVTEGEQLGDFIVSRIEGKSITLEKDGETHVVRLFAEGKVLPPLAPAAVPRVPVANVPSLPGADAQAAAGQGQPDNAGAAQMQPPPVPGAEQDGQQAPVQGRRGRRLNPSVPYPPGDPNFGVSQQAGAVPQAVPEIDQGIDPGQAGGEEEMQEQ